MVSVVVAGAAQVGVEGQFALGVVMGIEGLLIESLLENGGDGLIGR